MDWEDFAIQCEDLEADLDALPDAAQDFSDSVSRRLAGMREWAEEHEHATEKMWTALENMREGVSKWLDRGVGKKPQITVRLEEHQRAFWERKKKDLRKRLHSSQRSMISNSSVFQALVELWMVLDADGDIEEKIREFQARHRTPEEEDDEESSSDAH